MKANMSCRGLTGIIEEIGNRHCERLKGAWQSIKNNKKCYKLAFFTGLLCRNLQFLLAMTCIFFTLPSYGKPRVVTSITPIASIVTMLVKDKADIESLAVSGGCPHHYSLKPSDLAKVKNADIAIYIDEQFDGFAKKLIDNHSKNAIKISDIKALKIIKDNNVTNWHIWLDLDNTQILLQEFAKIFSDKFPNLRKDINNNLPIALKELQSLQKIKNNELATLKDVILLSDSAEYFFVNTNIKTTKLYSNNQKSLKYFSKLEDLIKHSHNKCLILSTEQNPEVYNKLNVKTVIINSENWEIKNIDSNSFQNQYLQMIYQVKKCL